MSYKASAVLKCERCGKYFTKGKLIIHKENVETWLDFATLFITACPECFEPEAIALLEKVPIIEKKYHFPELKGKSEKQIQFAHKVRVYYAIKHETELDLALRRLLCYEATYGYENPYVAHNPTRSVCNANNVRNIRNRKRLMYNLCCNAGLERAYWVLFAENAVAILINVAL